MAERTFRFGEEEIQADSDMSIEQVRKIWEGVHPSLANAQYTQAEDGSVTFEVRAGSKG